MTAGANGFGTTPVRGFATRRHLFWVGLIGLLALMLPYATLVAATVRAIVAPPAAAIDVPELSLPVARFPALTVPKIVRPQTAAAPQRTAAAPSTTRQTTTSGTRRRVARTASAGAAGRVATRRSA